MLLIFFHLISLHFIPIPFPGLPFSFNFFSSSLVSIIASPHIFYILNLMTFHILPNISLSSPLLSSPFSFPFLSFPFVSSPLLPHPLPFYLILSYPVLFLSFVLVFSYLVFHLFSHLPIMFSSVAVGATMTVDPLPCSSASPFCACHMFAYTPFDFINC